MTFWGKYTYPRNTWSRWPSPSGLTEDAETATVAAGEADRPTDSGRRHVAGRRRGAATAGDAGGRVTPRGARDRVSPRVDRGRASRGRGASLRRSHPPPSVPVSCVSARRCAGAPAVVTGGAASSARASNAVTREWHDEVHANECGPCVPVEDGGRCGGC